MTPSTLVRATAVASCFLVSVTFAAPPLPERVSHGSRIKLTDYLVPGKTVIFGFFSKFSPGCPCEPCARLGDPLAALEASREDVHVVMVDIDREDATGIDWNSPVAMQYSLRSLPHFKVFGPDSELIADDAARAEEAPAREHVHAMIEALPEHGALVAKANP
ncbi:thioredoxin family protein [Synoicihabitans lomoniglobus]|uniref:Thioredoxin family protein n=1 Tax=Synoicihabitans lomoniglobus TaxID=2909285 RepID=A0AAE9ZVF7_9BACT|nr:thioredoxin family protein [Opitutaceae bacterium LMO-M01]WED64812.1 thioredoxin family protein [Opitutaceae bacterium LMO-M01]